MNFLKNMKGAEFIGIFRPLNNEEINDPVRGIILYQQEKDLEIWDNLLLVFSLGDLIWKRSGRRNILEKLLIDLDKNNTITQRSQRIKFKVTKILKKGVQVDELVNKIKDHKEYKRWKDESKRTDKRTGEKP
jgi:hypothetical protein